MSDEMVGPIERMPGDTDGYSAWVERLEPIAAQRVGWMHERITRLEHQLRQERQRRESLERRHANLVAHTQTEHGSRQRLEQQLDALLMVWCSGGCGGGVLRWVDPDRYPNWRERRTEVTEEIVAFAEQNTRRLRAWFEGNKRRALVPAEDGEDKAHG